MGRLLTDEEIIHAIERCDRVTGAPMILQVARVVRDAQDANTLKAVGEWMEHHASWMELLSSLLQSKMPGERG